MKYDSVIAFKQEVLAEIDAKLNVTNEGPKVEAIINQRPENRIAVGYSQIAKHNFRLELRVQRRDMAAFKYAESIVERAPSEANIEIIPRIEIPTGKESSTHLPCKPPIVDRDTGMLEIGMSIGPKDSGVGTLGAFVSRADGEYILSCNHVMVSGSEANTAKESMRGDPIFHPGREVGYRLDATRQIASLSNYIVLSRTVENDIDCAIAKLDNGWRYDITRIPVGHHYPNEGHSISVMPDPDTGLQRDMVACKIGRTTCYTRGLVRAIEIDRVPVFVPGEGNVLFSNVIEIRSLTIEEPFSLPGDSGSLVFTEEGHEAIGLVFAGGTRADGYKVTYVCKLLPILKWAKAELLVEKA